MFDTTPYSTVDQDSLRKKAEAIKMEPVGLASTNSAKLGDTPLPTIPRPNATNLPTATATPVPTGKEPSGFDKAVGYANELGAPVVNGAMNVITRNNITAETGKEADALTLNSAMEMGKVGSQIGTVLGGPAGTIIGGAAGAVGGAIYGGFRKDHDRKVMKRREQKKYVAALVKTAAERDRDNRMDEAQDAIAAEKQVIQTQLGLIG